MKRKVIIYSCIILIILALIISNFHSASAANVMGPSTGLQCEGEVEGPDGKTTKTCTLQLELLEDASFNTLHVWFSTLSNLKVKEITYFDNWYFKELESDEVTYVIQSTLSKQSKGIIKVATFVLENG